MTPTTEEVRQALRDAFPASAYYGVVTDCRDHCDEGRGLHTELSHKRWDEVLNMPYSFIFDYCISLPLLTPEAFVAFLPAWLTAATDSLDRNPPVSDNLLLEFTLYAVCPNCDPEESPARAAEERWDKRFPLFNEEQRKAVLDFLRLVQSREELRDYFDEHLRSGIARWSR